MDKPGFNFSAGPTFLAPRVQEELLKATTNCEGSGYSLYELGHRSQLFGNIVEELTARVRHLLDVPPEFDILFCPGGGSMQFSAVPLNLCTQGCRGGYIITGLWSLLAYREADRISRAYVLWNGDDKKLPSDKLVATKGTDFVLYCDNETVDGKEFQTSPNVDLGDAVLVADMSSNILTRQIDWSRHACVFAALQKNMGTAGATMVIVRRELYGSISAKIPELLSWKAYAQTDSIPNTPPVVAIYTALLVSRCVQEEGGVEVMAERAQKRSCTVYSALDSMSGFYLDLQPPAIRSRINIVFRLETEAIEQLFLAEAIQAGLYNLNGYSTRGGMRASLYNAMPQEGADALAKFLTEFYQRHG